LAFNFGLQAAPQLKVSPDQKSGIYELGQKVTWNVSLKEGDKPLEGSIDYTVTKGGLTKLTSGTVELNQGEAKILSMRDDPGTLLLTVKYKPKDGGKELSALGGAVFAPEKIKASSPPPEDFEKFWKDQIDQLNKIGMNAQLERVDVGDKNVEYYKITLDNIRGIKIHGQLAKPTGKTNLPALLQVQWAGVYPLQKDWILGYARNGWLVLNISAHDLPIDEKEEFYKQKSNKELNDYPGIGNDDRNTSYFLPMFLSCWRAVDYLTQSPDWNKKTLVVQGGSQGGYQALVTAGFHPAVTAVAANVPAGCDHTGKAVGRAPGWPNWASRTWQKKDEKKMLEASRYFDVVNFAKNIKCPALIGIGLVDTVCPPEGAIAACNQIPGSKKVVIMPQADHGGDHKAYYEQFGPFLENQRKAAK
jgi:cephalosporin-C deacetylase-like acetyl esterase